MARTRAKSRLSLRPAILARLALLVAWLSAMHPPPAGAQSAAQIQADIIAAILGTGSFTPPELEALDLNGDSAVDAADLLQINRTITANPTANFTLAESGAGEASGSAEIEIHFDKPFSGTLAYSVGGTASSGVDFAALPGTLAVSGAFAAIPVTILNNPGAEPPETIVLTIQGGLDYNAGAEIVHSLTINDDDGGTPIAFFAGASAEADEGSGVVTVQVNFTAPFTGTLLYAAGGTAASAEDYLALPGSAVLAAASSVEIPVTILPDSLNAEGPETIDIAISAGAGYAAGVPALHRITIEDDVLSGVWTAIVELEGPSDDEGEFALAPIRIGYPIYFTLARLPNGLLAGEVAEADAFDPTKHLLKQVGPANPPRDSYEVSPMFAVGTPVEGELSNGGNTLTLRLSQAVAMGGATGPNAENPLPVALARSVELTFNGDRTAAASLSGLSTELTGGFRPEAKNLTMLGGASLIYQGPLNGAGAGARPASAGNAQSAARGNNFRLALGGSPEARAALDAIKSGSAEASALLARRLAARASAAAAGAAAGSAPAPSLDAMLGESIFIALADYQNLLFASPPAPPNDGVPAESVAFLGGSAGASAPTDGVFTLESTVIAQPFAGPAFFTGPPGATFDDFVNALYAAASGEIGGGTAFISDFGVTKGSDPFDGTPATGFDEAAVAAAEFDLALLIALDPLDERAQTALLDSRIRRATAYNLRVDRLMLQQFNARLDTPGGAGLDVLNAEIALLTQARDFARTAANLAIECYADGQPRGAGAALRGEFLPLTEPLFRKVPEAVRIAAESLRRLAEAQFLLSRKLLLRDFFTPSRETAIDDLASLQVYLTESARILSAYSELTDFGDAGVGALNGLLVTAASLEAQLRQGFNAFGFDPNFVPFFDTASEASPDAKFNVTQSVGFAANWVTIADGLESTARSAQREYVATVDAYNARIQELETSYEERLRALCGVVRDPGLPPEDQLEPDLFTFALPTEAARRAIVETQAGRQLTSLGQISIQYANLDQAYLRLQVAANDLENLFEEMEIHQETAQEIANDLNNLAQIQLGTGDAVAMLTREKGRIQKEAALAQAELQKRSSLTGQLVFHVESFFSDPIGYYFESSPAIVLIEDLAGIDIPPPPFPPFFLPREGERGTDTVGVALAAVALGVTLIQDYGNYSTAMEKGEVAGELAEAEAEIDAQIEEVRAMEAAEVTFQQMREVLARAEEELKILALKRANLELSIKIAQRDVVKERMALANMVSEAQALIADWAKARRLAEENLTGESEAWLRPDYRGAFLASQANADAAFQRAQAACFLALRALDYFVNQPEDTFIRDLYRLCYQARRAADLNSLIAFINDRLAFQGLVAAADCPRESSLSLKFDILTRTPYSLDGNSNPVNPAGAQYFSYFDPSTGQELSGEAAYQRRLKNFLRENLSGPANSRVLRFEFSTDLFPNRPKSEPIPGGTPLPPTAENPFFDPILVNQVGLGSFSPPGCGSPFQGLIVNLVGNGIPNNPVQALRVTLIQKGNLFLRSEPNSRSVSDPLYDPLEGIVAYSSYVQQFPTSFLVDPNSPPPLISFTSTRTARIDAYVNGAQVNQERSLIFTDRAVACDSWVFQIDSERAPDREFLNQLAAALEDTQQEFNLITDIQIRLGWFSKVIQTN